MRSRLEEVYATRVDLDSAILPWLVGYAGWLITHFQVKVDGKTPYERLRHRPYQGEVVEFGETVHSKDPDKLGKLEDRWFIGAWLGKSLASDEQPRDRARRPTLPVHLATAWSTALEPEDAGQAQREPVGPAAEERGGGQPRAEERVHHAGQSDRARRREEVPRLLIRSRKGPQRRVPSEVRAAPRTRRDRCSRSGPPRGRRGQPRAGAAARDGCGHAG